jgi:hypothetical protein
VVTAAVFIGVGIYGGKAKQSAAANKYSRYQGDMPL